MSPEEYKSIYKRIKFEVETPLHALNVDLKMEVSDKKDVLLLLDLDQTVLASEYLKILLQQELQKADSVITEDVWKSTYEQSKPGIRVYDHNIQAKLLSELTEHRLSENNIVEIIETCLLNKISEVIFPNIINFLETNKDKIDLGIITAGLDSFQWLKVSALTKFLPIQSVINIFVTHMLKGEALSILLEYKETKEILGDRRIFVFDDNTSELEDIAGYNFDNVEIVRVKQKGGKHNSTEINKDFLITELDLQNGEPININLNL